MGDLRTLSDDIVADNAFVPFKETSMCDSRNLKFENARLETFSNWPAEAPVAADRIARAGFYYTGKDYEVKCFSCNKTISTWKIGDLVSKRHAELNPRCDFVGNKSDNVPLVKRTASAVETRSFPSSSNASGSGYSGIRRDVSWRSEPVVLSTSTAEEKTWDSFRSLLNEAERLRTFRGWPVVFVLPAELARAGFFYLKEKDRVQCIFCRVIISDWEEGDVPITEHHRHSPSCRFIKGFEVGNVALGDVDPMLRSEESSSSPSNDDDITGRYNYEMQMFSGPENGHASTLDLENANLSNLGITRHTGPKHPNYATSESRARTFEHWPSSIPQDPERLVDAGFYYAGVSDHVRCFNCDGGLRNWEPTDDPWMEHARWFGKCTYLLLMKGHEFVHHVKNVHPPHLPEPNEDNENGDREILEEWTRSDIAKMVLNLGIARDVVKQALQRKLQQNRIPFSKPEELYEACFEIQSELRRDRMPNGVGEVMTSASKSQPRLPNGTVPHLPNQVNGTLSSSFSTPNIRSFTQASTSENKTEAMVLLEENQRLKEMQQCKICMAEEVGVVFLPCGHLITCPKCAPCVTECPLCRRPIQHTVRTYLS